MTISSRNEKLYFSDHDIAIVDFVWKERMSKRQKKRTRVLSRTASQDGSNRFLVDFR